MQPNEDRRFISAGNYSDSRRCRWISNADFLDSSLSILSLSLSISLHFSDVIHRSTALTNFSAEFHFSDGLLILTAQRSSCAFTDGISQMNVFFFLSRSFTRKDRFCGDELLLRLLSNYNEFHWIYRRKMSAFGRKIIRLRFFCRLNVEKRNPSELIPFFFLSVNSLIENLS